MSNTAMNANTLLTDSELRTLLDCASESDWDNACDAVKRARNGQYPNDWFRKVILSGLLGKISSNWGGDDKIRISVL